MFVFSSYDLQNLNHASYLQFLCNGGMMHKVDRLWLDCSDVGIAPACLDY